MPPRRRKTENKDLPPNLYTNTVGDKVYYYFEHPIQHWREQLGTDRKAAIATTKALNGAIERDGIDPAKRAIRVTGKTVGQALDEYAPRALAKLKSDNNRKNTKNYLERLRKALGARPLKAITVLELSDYLQPMPDRTYIRLRYHLQELFAYALSRGYLPHNYGNPAAVLEKRVEPERVRERLSIEAFNEIYPKAGFALQLTMDCMLHTTTRPDNIVNWLHSQYRDGAIHFQSSKNFRFYRMKLRPIVIDRVIKRSKFSGLKTDYIIHQEPGRRASPENWPKWRKCGYQVSLDAISREFSEIRDSLEMFEAVPVELRPPMYEVRSLASHLYKQEGNIDKQALANLMTHNNEEMQAVYQAGHDVEWIDSEAGLSESYLKSVGFKL